MDSVEKGFRFTGAEVSKELADGLAAKRAALDLPAARVERAGCLQDWSDRLRAEKAFLHAQETAKRVAREQAEEEREKREVEKLREAAEEEERVKREKEEKKARFLGSCKGLRWL